MKYLYFFVLMGIAVVITLVIIIISIKEHIENKKNSSTGFIQNNKDLDGVSGKEIYGTWTEEKKKYKSFVKKILN